VNGGGRAKFDAALADCRVQAAVLSDDRRSLDQAAYRFMKLQDSLGEKVLPGILVLTLEPLPPEATFAEKLQRLERLGVLPSVQSWRLRREVRNSLAHEYPENPALQAAMLTRFMTGLSELLAVWTCVDGYVAQRLGLSAAGAS
jgi:hypothetical protein